jgi:exodeoxyribonuclease-5
MLSHPAELLNIQQLEALTALVKFIEDPLSETFGLYGFAGTGKSTVLAYFSSTQSARQKRIAFCAPTHKAVTVLRNMADPDSTVPQHDHYYTVAKLLGMKQRINDDGKREFAPDSDSGTYLYSGTPITKLDLVVVDECSMLGEKTVGWLQEAGRQNGVKIVFVGDAFQLPPVKEEKMHDGKSLSFQVPSEAVTLSTVERFHGDIAVAVTAVRESIGTGVTPLFTPSSTLVRHTGSSEFLNRFLEHAEVGQIIAYRNAMVDWCGAWVRNKMFGADALPFVKGERLVASSSNKHWHVHQEFRVASAEPSVQMGYQCWELRMEDSFMTIHSMTPEQRDALQDDLSKLKRTAVNASKYEAKQHWAKYYDLVDAFPTFRSGYAQTIHASQGSTYPYVFVLEKDVKKIKDKEYYGKMLYVAYSRASKELHIL